MGKIVGTPVWEENGPTGPGIYADLQVFKPYQAAVQEMAPHIGMSIRALGRARVGEVDGQKMPVIESIEQVRSVDAVTLPGRGGEILQLFEAARGGQAIKTEEVPTVDEKEAQALREAAAAKDAEIAAKEAEIVALQGKLLSREARDFVAAELGKSGLPDVARAKLLESLANRPVLKDGAVDKDAYGTVIAEAAKAEAEYIAKLVPAGSAIRGMGQGGTPAASQSLRESFEVMYGQQGYSPEQAKRLAELAIPASAAE
jgi:hypothetical protein